MCPTSLSAIPYAILIIGRIATREIREKAQCFVRMFRLRRGALQNDQGATIARGCRKRGRPGETRSGHAIRQGVAVLVEDRFCRQRRSAIVIDRREIDQRRLAIEELERRGSRRSLHQARHLERSGPGRPLDLFLLLCRVVVYVLRA